MNITTFKTWCINSFIHIGSQILSYLDQIKIYGTISLMDFIITIVIVGAFLSIIITSPRLSLVRQIRSERKPNK